MAEPTHAAIRRHVSIEFDLVVSDAAAIQAIAHPAMRTYVDAFIEAADRVGLDAGDDVAPLATLGPDELHTVVAALTRSALTAGVDAVFPMAGTVLTNIVVEDVALD